MTKTFKKLEKIVKSTKVVVFLAIGCSNRAKGDAPGADGEGGGHHLVVGATARWG